MGKSVKERLNETIKRDKKEINEEGNRMVEKGDKEDKEANLDDFMNEKTILSKDRKTPADIWISYIAFIYGLYFKESLLYIKENNYVNKLIDRFNYELDNTKEKIEKIRNKGNKYIIMEKLI